MLTDNSEGWTLWARVICNDGGVGQWRFQAQDRKIRLMCAETDLRKMNPTLEMLLLPPDEKPIINGIARTDGRTD